jgi:hypothetical protein
LIRNRNFEPVDDIQRVVGEAMGARQVLGYFCRGLVFLGTLGIIAFALRDRNLDRVRKYRKDLFWLMALIVFIMVLMETLLPENSWLRCLVIPIFVFGGYYIFYDAFIR